MSDLYVDAKMDLDRIRKLFQRLHLKKEKEIAVRRVSKRLGASEIKEMREMEATIAALLERQKIVTNAQQRNLFETYKNQFQASARKHDGDLDAVIASWTTVEVDTNT